MMLFISRSRTLPDERHDLYMACIEHMLSAYRREVAHVPGMAHHWRPEKMNERLRATAALAFAVHQQEERTAGRAIVVSAKAMAQLVPQSCHPQSSGFLSWLTGPAGLLTDSSDGSLSFAHLSFQEYLAAWHIANVLPEDKQRSDRRLTDRRWREVLRLWAAILWSGRRERFEAAAEGFLDTGAGLASLGAILADGWGSPALFRRWLEKFLPFVAACRPQEVADCGDAWGMCRQVERRSELQNAWNRDVPNWNWFARSRAMAWNERARLELPPALGQSAVIHEALDAGVTREEHCALGRVWTFAIPMWPELPPEVALCQVWPSSRRILGMRVQTFVSLLGESGWSSVAAGGSSAGKVKPQNRERAQSVEKVGLLLEGMLKSKIFADHKQYFEQLSRAWKSYSVGYLEPFGLQLTRSHAAFQQQEGGGLFMDDFAATFVSITDRALNVRLPSPLDVASVFAVFLADGPEHASRDFAAAVGLDEYNPAVRDLALIETAAFSRSSACAVFGSIPATGNGPVDLISTACRESLDPGEHKDQLDRALASYEGDPLWPALARHLTRQPTKADHELLVDLAQHPEKREPPLRWGLQFIVRGDVMMPDNSIQPLDNFFTRHRLAVPSYLDDVAREPSPGKLNKGRKA